MVSSPKKYKYHQKYKCPNKCPFFEGGVGAAMDGRKSYSHKIRGGLNKL